MLVFLENVNPVTLMMVLGLWERKRLHCFLGPQRAAQNNPGLSDALVKSWMWSHVRAHGYYMCLVNLQCLVLYHFCQESLKKKSQVKWRENQLQSHIILKT
jgi:hypothetical protein